MVSEEDIRKKLRYVVDPEIGINVVDLGLIYDINIKDNNDVYIKMTLTTPTCPLADVIVDNVKFMIKSIEEVDNVDVELVFDPPWSPEMMDEKARENLFF